MKVLKLIGVLVVSLIMFIVLSIPRTLLLVGQLLELVFRIVNNTLTFFIKFTKEEVLKYMTDVRTNETKQPKG